MKKFMLLTAALVFLFSADIVYAQKEQNSGKTESCR